MFKRDQFIFGLILGTVSPILSMLVYYFIQFYPHIKLAEYLDFLRKNTVQLTALSVPFLLLNIILFTVYINRKKDKTAKGIFTITLIIALTTLLIRWFS